MNSNTVTGDDDIGDAYIEHIHYVVCEECKSHLIIDELIDVLDDTAWSGGFGSDDPSRKGAWHNFTCDNDKCQSNQVLWVDTNSGRYLAPGHPEPR